jgi:Sulfatase/C-terminal region of aryl-sulfatase
MNINFMKVHQPNMPAPEFQLKSLSKSKYADSVVELDTRIGRIMDKVRALGLDKNTFVFYTTDNGAWQDVYPDAGYTPFRGTKGTVREGGNRVPAIAWMPGKIAAGMKNHDILGGLDLMATFASIAGVKLPENDRAGQPIIFDSEDMSPVLFATGKSARKSWFYFTEDELSPGAARVGNYKAVFNLRGDNGASTGGLAVDTNQGWKGPNKYVATVPQVFDLWQDPQERYDVFMNNYTERTWTLVTINAAIAELMKTYVKYPPANCRVRGTRVRSRSPSMRNFSTFATCSQRRASESRCPLETESRMTRPRGGSPGAITPPLLASAAAKQSSEYAITRPRRRLRRRRSSRRCQWLGMEARS